jgi:C-5 cytosine-specific DNA methylase
MGLDSSVALGSDTIIVDTGIDLATSVSVTSVSSDNAALKTQDVSNTIFGPANDPLYQDEFNRELSTECLSTQERDQSGEEGSGLVVPKTRPQRHWPISVVRLLQNEETTEAESSPDPNTGDESSEDTTSSEKSSIGSISEEETTQNSRLCHVSSNSSEESSIGSSSEEETAQNSSLWRVSSNKNVSRRTKQLLVTHQEQKQLRPLGRLQKLDCVSVPPLLIPKSRYCGWKHSLPVIDEISALSRILQLKAESEVAPPNFHDILIDDYVIYRPGSRTYYPWQMVTLDSIISSREGCKYLINGALRFGGTTQYVEAAEIDIDAISVDGFEDYDIHSVQNMVYLQTVVCARRRNKVEECWYRLGEPSEQYQVLHNKFLWVADLAKHVVDYLHWRGDLDGGSSMVHLKDFQHDFVTQLMEWHAGDTQFQKWMQSYNQSDFRSAINRHREFVFSRALNLGGRYLKYDLWSELMVRPVSSIADKNRPSEDTLVTPYVRHCCKSMPWSYALRSKRMSESVQNGHERRASAMGFPIPSVDRRLSGMTDKIAKSAALLESAAKSASVIAIEAEEALGRFAIIRMRQSDGSSSGEQFSYVYIQGIVKRQRVSELKVIFVYLPSDPICLDGYYPRGDELFLSECCNCSANNEPILVTDVVRLVGVTFGDEADGLEGFFVRQKYVYAEDAICRLKESDFQCPCRRPIFSGSMDKVGREEREPLSGLGLFAGCGNFDLGLETSGAIKFVAAVEINETSLKTYATNRSQGLAGLILDSVNPCLSQIFEGSADLPGVGSIDFISAGSPCPGFSRVNSRRGEDKGMRNCSLVASTVSYIETYLPNYAILENVGAMGSGVGNSGNQVIACLVSLGYQIRRMELNSRNYRSAQTEIGYS